MAVPSNPDQYRFSTQCALQNGEKLQSQAKDGCGEIYLSLGRNLTHVTSPQGGGLSTAGTGWGVVIIA